ncbi:uncharacterized protein LOC124326628 isoform X2 [Daphnia pulicaria]|uniref:uncharacterized protein LOC124326628 isoform X2 n=1 Tax=Daphnia pulicaria TaxID=35523 RepID=UPI001EEC57C4|nr:uncharacterized protein LOC124326628 isoform X2 [Daphnia pulicaria]
MEFQRHDECEVNNLPCVCTCTRSAHENISANTKVMNFVLVVNGVRRWLPLLAFCDVLISVWNNCSGLWGILTHNRGHEKHYVKLACSGVETHPQQRLPKEGKASLHFNRRSWRSLQKGVIQWSRGWVRTGRVASLSRS